MIEFSNVEQYRENNRIEAKRAAGGLPYSVWETYSSFANTMGGVILLGVEEGKDKSFRAIGLKDPERLIERFWRQLNDPRRVSVNILTRRDVHVEYTDQKAFVVIEVPRARRADRPVYIENDPLRGTYRRGGEGDYRCTPEEIEAMRRDAAAQTEDMLPLPTQELTALDPETLADYRAAMRALRPGHVFEALSDEDFLERTGGAARDTQGALRPTGAGLLLFGRWDAITRVYPSYRPVFCTASDGKNGCQSDPERTLDCYAIPENLYHFYRRCSAGLRGLFRTSERGRSVTDEALINCLVNADYRAKGSIHIQRLPDRLCFSNPGGFRIHPNAARSSATSDSRNKGLARLFNLIGIGHGTGGGIARMFADWRASGHPSPYFLEEFDPERTLLTLPYYRKKKKTSEKSTKKRTLPLAPAKQMIADYLTERIDARAAQIASAVGLPLSRVRRLLADMQRERLVTVEGSGKSARWRLKEKADATAAALPESP
ncbi:MAG: AAA family ATPase [Ruminococcaceae bacterium]|nr:AAA family ATPase [Oscillospiraceae bacterium]